MKKGYRVNDSREFFSASVSDTIDIILQIPDEEDEKSAKLDYDSKPFWEKEENELAKDYFELAEKYYHGLDGNFQDYDKALAYYEKSALLEYADAYEKIGDIWMGKDDSQKAVKYYLKAVDNFRLNCYAKLARIYMDEEDKLYNERNANLAWTKYFEYLERHKDSLLINSEFIVYSVGFELYYYFRKYLLCDKITNEHINFINTHVSALISILSTFSEKVNIPHINNFVNKSILPYLYNIFTKKLYISEDAHNFLFGNNNIEKDINKALNLYIKYADNGAINANAYIGICYYEMGQIDKADRSWQNFYNDVHDLIIGNLFSAITDEQKKLLLEAFYLIFYRTSKGNDTNIIHKFYYMVAYHLGFVDYVKIKTISLTNSFLSNICSLSKIQKEDITTEINHIAKILDRLSEVISNCQGDNWERPHRL